MTPDITKQITSGNSETFSFDPDKKDYLTKATAQKLLTEINRALKAGKKVSAIVVEVVK